MELLKAIVTFSSFTLACSVALMLLPEGTVKRTVLFSFGIISMLLWLQGLGSLELPDGMQSPAPVLLESSVGLPDSAALAECERVLSARASETAGFPARVDLDGSVPIISLIPAPCSDAISFHATGAEGADASVVTFAGR